MIINYIAKGKEINNVISYYGLLHILPLSMEFLLSAY